jgi:putative ABC transport system permease protein
VKEDYRDARGVRPLEELVQDVRHGFRSLGRAPAFTIAIVLTLALGIGANTAIFSVVHGVLLRALPYSDPDRIVVVWETDRNSSTLRELASVPDYFDFLSRSRSFASLAGAVQFNRTWIGDEAERVSGAAVSASMFSVLGVTPRLGRIFTAEEDAPGGPGVIIVSDRFWRTRLAASTAAIGQQVRFDDSLYTLVGVLPADVRFPDASVDVWFPLQSSATSAQRSWHIISVVGRLRPGVTLAAAQNEMASIARQLEEEYRDANDGRGVNLEPLPEVLVGGVRRTLFILLGAVGLVLLIACANAASLFLARLSARAREVAVRSALGATRRRLAQQFFVESLLVTLAASAVGVLFAAGGLRALLALAPESLPRRGEIMLDGPVLAATLAVSILVAMAFGILPALQGGRPPSDNLQGNGTRGGTATREHHRFRGGLVVAEVALSLVLVVSAGLLGRSFANVRAENPGFTPERVLKLRYQLPSSRYPQNFAEFPQGWGKLIGYNRDILARVQALDGVRSVAIAANDPLAPGFANSFVIEGRESEAAAQAELATRPVSAGYFETVGIPLLRGRHFAATDDPRAPKVMIINDAAARQYFPGQDPVGKRIRFWGSSREIIGVVGNERFAGLTAAAPPAMYPPLSQTPMGTATLLVSTRSDPRQVLAGVRREMRAMDPNVAPFEIQTMEEVLEASVAPQRFAATLLGSFAAVALALALVGIYGVVAYTVAQRTREIGVRVALGATTRDVVRYVLGNGLRLALLGSALGVLGAIGAGRLLSTQLFGVTAGDPLTLVAAVAGMLTVAVVASYVPARRAAGVAPMVALRVD